MSQPPPLFSSPLPSPAQDSPLAGEAAVFVQRLVQPAAAPAAETSLTPPPALPEPPSSWRAGASPAPADPVLPPADPGEKAEAAQPPAPASENASSRDTDPLGRLLANPLLLAGGALAAGVVIGRLLGASGGAAVSRTDLADEIADAILKKTRQPDAGADGATAAAAGAGSQPPSADPLRQLVEEFRPQAARAVENLTKMLADLLRK